MSMFWYTAMTADAYDGDVAWLPLPIWFQVGALPFRKKWSKLYAAVVGLRLGYAYHSGTGGLRRVAAREPGAAEVRRSWVWTRAPIRGLGDRRPGGHGAPPPKPPAVPFRPLPML